MEIFLIVGGGAAGLMAAYTAAQHGAKAAVLERNENMGQKLLLTGKGRCNLTNNCAELRELIANIPGNGQFLYSAFAKWMPQDTMDFFEKQGVSLKTERGRRVFPLSDAAADVVKALVHACRKSGVSFIRGRAEKLILEDKVCCGVIYADGREYCADRVIVATGGLSYPKTGSSGDGYKLAAQAGHTIIPPRPSLVGLECHEGYVSQIQGLSLRNVALSVLDSAADKTIFQEQGELLFTHFGVSGPLALSASAHMRQMSRGRYILRIDLKPARTLEQLDERLRREIVQAKSRNFINVLNVILPKSLVPVTVRLAGFPLDLQAAQLSREQRRSFASLLKALPLTVTDFRPVDEAVITAGGVCVKEINPKTMESRLVKNLFFAGEVMDVDGYTGGYNLQIAFATGRLAGTVEA